MSRKKWQFNEIFPEYNIFVAIRPCSATDIIETDTFRELKLSDKVYDV